MARNNLTKIEREMFADLRFIDTIDVAENQIREISPDAFKSIYLTKVTKIFFNSIALNIMFNFSSWLSISLLVYILYPRLI